MKPPTEMKHLSAAQRDHFDKSGYLLPFRAVDEEQAASYLARLEAFEQASGTRAEKRLKIKAHLAFPWIVGEAKHEIHLPVEENCPLDDARIDVATLLFVMSP